MSFDLARYLAGRVRVLAPLPPQSTYSDILRACRQRGYGVYEADFIPEQGRCLQRMNPVILVRSTAPARALAHELLHAIIWENTSNGIEYEPPEWNEDTEENAADRFAALLAGEDA
jgi:Zn-dependent peptidase ImmA (M78 family)